MTDIETLQKQLRKQLRYKSKVLKRELLKKLYEYKNK